MYKLLPILLFAYGLTVTTDDIYDNSWALIINKEKIKLLDVSFEKIILNNGKLVDDCSLKNDNTCKVLKLLIKKSKNIFLKYFLKFLYIIHRCNIDEEPDHKPDDKQKRFTLLNSSAIQSPLQL